MFLIRRDTIICRYEGFYTTKPGNNTFTVGLRGDCTGVMTGSAFAIVGGIVTSIEVIGVQ